MDPERTKCGILSSSSEESSPTHVPRTVCSDPGQQPHSAARVCRPQGPADGRGHRQPHIAIHARTAQWLQGPHRRRHAGQPACARATPLPIRKFASRSQVTGLTATEAAQSHCMRLEVVKKNMAKRGIVLLPLRWVVERSFAWTARHSPQRISLRRLRMLHDRQHVQTMNFITGSRANTP